MNFKSKKGQSATEFVVLVSFMLVVFFIFFLIIQNRIVDMSVKQDKQYLEEANNIVLSEVELAKNALPDYTRTFKLKVFPGQEYKIQILNQNEIVTSFKKLEYVKFLQYNISGELNELINPTNTIYKTDGIIHFDNGTIENKPEYKVTSLNVNAEECYKANKNDTTCPSLTTKTLCQDYFGLCLG